MYVLKIDHDKCKLKCVTHCDSIICDFMRRFTGGEIFIIRNLENPEEPIEYKILRLKKECKQNAIFF